MLFKNLGLCIFLLFFSGCASIADRLGAVDNGLLGIHIYPEGMDYSALPVPKKYVFGKKVLGKGVDEKSLADFESEVSNAIYDSIWTTDSVKFTWYQDSTLQSAMVVFRGMPKHEDDPERPCFWTGIIPMSMQGFEFESYNVATCWTGDHLRIGKYHKMDL